jgi:hypothetical protein
MAKDEDGEIITCQQSNFRFSVADPSALLRTGFGLGENS